MPTVTIACPHCHFARSLPLEKVPRSIASATCPECNRSFMPQPQVMISCPHCNFSQEMPLGKLPTKAINASCPECRKQFPLPMRTSAPTTAAPAVQPAAPAAAKPAPPAPSRILKPATPQPPLPPLPTLPATPPPAGQTAAAPQLRPAATKPVVPDEDTTFEPW